MNSLFSIAYLPPLSWFTHFITADKIYIEACEHYVKQSYRNRCYIYGPNGRQSLVVPVVHGQLFRTPVRDVLISTDTKWNLIHWKSITSAYRNSAYFEFFEDDFREIYLHPGEKLFDFNLRLINLLLGIFKVEKKYELTASFEADPDWTDLRNVIHPKSNAPETKPYRQVFGERHGFIRDLSAIDYLFNEGNRFWQ